MKSGTYRAPPVRRVHIPKGDGSETRPIGIPTFEDKVLQRAVAMVLEAVYESQFYDFSYGFRPGRSAHQACEALKSASVRMAGGWVLEVDIKKFFDTLDHGHLREILSRRVGDGVILRLIGKWLNAGVMEGLALHHPETGTPQGGVISPLLANIYLHEVLDQWLVRDVLPRLSRRAVPVRYADDFLIVFAQKRDAERVLEVLPKRFGRYGLTVHPDKTRLVPFTGRTAMTGTTADPVPSTSWASRIIGAYRATASGFRVCARRRTASVARSVASLSGAAGTATTMSRCRDAHSRAACSGITPTTASRRILARSSDSATR